MKELFMNPETKELRLGNQKLPDFESLDFEAKAVFEEKKISGQSGKLRDPQGYADIPITLKFRLVNDSKGKALEKLTILKKLFRQTDAQLRQVQYRLSSPLLNLFEVRTVFIEKLKVTQSIGLTNGIRVEMSLIEAENPAAKREKKQRVVQAEKVKAPQDFGKEPQASNPPPTEAQTAPAPPSTVAQTDNSEALLNESA